MLFVWALAVVCDASMAAQPNEPSYAWIGMSDHRVMVGTQLTSPLT